jgi:hypothetical protein
MRLQHNMEPTPPARTLARKRKQPDADILEPISFATFQVEHAPEETSAAADEESDDESEDEGDGVPMHLSALLDPVTGNIMGRSKDMVRYLIAKAKLQYAMEQHSILAEELRTLRSEEMLAREAKDKLLDDVMRAELGYVLLFPMCTHPRSREPVGMARRFSLLPSRPTMRPRKTLLYRLTCGTLPSLTHRIHLPIREFHDLQCTLPWPLALGCLSHIIFSAVTWRAAELECTNTLFV